MFTYIRPLALGFLFACFSLGCTSKSTDGDFADTILLDGMVYTVDTDRTWAEAVSVKDGLIVQVGSNEDARALQGESTEVLNLEGRVVLPGLHDTHIHINGGESVFSEGFCNLPNTYSGATREQLIDEIRICRDSDPNATGWFVGAGWSGSAFPPDGAPDKGILDELFPERPVYLVADSRHLAWVNSRAMEIAGITNGTPDPENGSIKRNPDTGEATGTLFESAKSLVSVHLPSSTEADRDAALYRALQYANSLGITSVFNAIVSESDLESFTRLYNTDRLPAHLRTAVWGGSDSGKIISAEQVKALASKYESAGIKTHAVKLMLDGVMEGATAAQVSEYENVNHAGQLFVSPEELADALIEFDEAGIQVKMHGYGSLAVREGLNAVEIALLTNGQNDMRHHIDHSAQIHPDDYGRFAETGTSVGFSAYWATPNPYEIELALPLLGQERWRNSYPIKSVIDQDAIFISGSDWPVATMNPFLHFAAAISRIDPLNADRGPLNGDEVVSLDAVIASYTINAAYVMHQEKITGSIEVGKSADLIVLDRNIFEISADEIRGTQVEQTFFKGQSVFPK